MRRSERLILITYRLQLKYKLYSFIDDFYINIFSCCSSSAFKNTRKGRMDIVVKLDKRSPIPPQLFLFLFFNVPEQKVRPYHDIKKCFCLIVRCYSYKKVYHIFIIRIFLYLFNDRLMADFMIPNYVYFWWNSVLKVL